MSQAIEQSEKLSALVKKLYELGVTVTGASFTSDNDEATLKVELYGFESASTEEKSNS